jgi:hypothetical protein
MGDIPPRDRVPRNQITAVRIIPSRY